MLSGILPSPITPVRTPVADNRNVQIDDVAWTEPDYTRKDVNRAGKHLAWAWNTPQREWEPHDHDAYWDGLEVINNWRASHAFPLNTLQMNLRSVARKLDSAALVAQRIKRIVAIGKKLQAKPSLNLTQMQDIGGCRAVLKNVDTVRAAVDYYVSRTRIHHELWKQNDYIAEPKASGYRGVHLAWEYQSEGASSVYNGLRIEMQIRSRYQHAWATAVETAGAFRGQALKSSIGDADWLRFFVLMGSVIALQEKSPIVPGTTESERELFTELAHYARSLKVVERLHSYNEAFKSIRTGTGRQAHWFLLKLEPSTSRLFVTGFKYGQRVAAELAYADAEKEVRENPGTDAVLVSVDSVKQLKKAYPNYFADTRVFLDLMQRTLDRHRRRLHFAGVKRAPVAP